MPQGGPLLRVLPVFFVLSSSLPSPSSSSPSSSSSSPSSSFSSPSSSSSLRRHLRRLLFVSFFVVFFVSPFLASSFFFLRLLSLPSSRFRLFWRHRLRLLLLFSSTSSSIFVSFFFAMRSIAKTSTRVEFSAL